MKIQEDTKLDFRDVLIRPKRSTLSSRSEVNLTREMYFKYSDRTWTGVPIMVSNMDTVGTFKMYKTLSKELIITCLHKHYNLEDFQSLDFELNPNYYMLSTGINDSDWG